MGVYEGFTYGRIYNGNVTRSSTPIYGREQRLSPAYDVTSRAGHVIVYNYHTPASLPKDFWESDYGEESVYATLSDSSYWEGNGDNGYNGSRCSTVENTLILPSNINTLVVATTFDLDDFYIYDKTVNEYIFHGDNIVVEYRSAQQLLQRRRMLLSRGEKIPEFNVELPDYWRLDFTTTEVDEQVLVGYYCLNSTTLVDVILDGTSNKSLAINGAYAYVRIPTPGEHVLYIKINLPFVNNNYWWGLQNRTFTYVRAPYYWNNAIMVGNNNKYATIQRFDILNSALPLRANSYYWQGHINQLYVPIENLNWYKSYSPSNYTGYSKISDSIKGANFIYTTS